MKKNLLFISFTSFISLFFMISCSFDAKDNTPIKTNNETEEPVLSSIYIKKQCEKTEYNLNEKLDLYGIVVMGKYSDGSEIKIRGWTSEPANGSVLTTTGNINIKISYETFTTSFNISVKQPSDSYFWGTWVKMDDGTEYEVFEYEVISNTIQHKIVSMSENDIAVDSLGTFTKESENVMTCNNIPYFRKGKRNLSYTINVVDKRTKSFDSNSSSMGREAPTEVNDNLKMLVQSPNYPSYKKEYTVDPNGETVIEAPVADEPMDFIISNDDKLIVKSGFTAKEDGDSETITLVDSGIANLKITGEIETNDSNGYLYGNYDEGYELTLFASNIGDGDISMVSCSIYSEDTNLILESKDRGLIGIPIRTFLKDEPRRKIAKLQIKYNNLTEPYVDAKIKVVVVDDTGNVIEDFINLKFFRGVLPITVSAKQPHDKDSENYTDSVALNGFVIYPDGYHQHFSVKDNNSKLLFVPTFGQKAYKLVFSGATASTNSNTEMCYSVVPASIVPKKVPTGGEDFTSALQFGEHNLRNNVEDNAFSVDEAFAAVLPSKDIDWYSVVMDSENYYSPFDNWYYVQYYSEYGECPEAFFIKGGEYLTSEQLPNLSCDGYKFIGWYKDKDFSETFSGPVEENLKLYAKWSKKLAIKLMDGENELDVIECYVGDSISTLSVPEKGGYYFEGWTLSSPSNKVTKIEDNMSVLYAVWKEMYNDKSFIKVSGTELYDENNSEFFIKSMGLGNDSFGERSELPIQHHTEESYKELAEMGFNTVRFYLTYKMFESNENPGVYNQKVFDWIDSNVEWAKKNNIHIILDMQTPQGGYQSKGEGLALFTDENNKTRLANLWGKIASYYKNCSTIIGYDLVNEPQVPFNTDIQTSVAAWSELAQSCIDEIRKVDTNHVIFVERVTAIRGETYMEPDTEQCYPVVNDNNFVFQAQLDNIAQYPVPYKFHHV